MISKIPNKIIRIYRVATGMGNSVTFFLKIIVKILGNIHGRTNSRREMDWRIVKIESL